MVVSVALSAVSVGASGVAATYHGDADGAAGPAPAAFTARSLNRYSVPLSKPSKETDTVEASLPGTAVHVPQPGAGGAARTRYSQPVMPASEGSSQVSVTLPSPPVALSPAGRAGGTAGGGGTYGPAGAELTQPLPPVLLRARTPTM